MSARPEFNRNFQIAYGIRVAKDPAKMSREEIEDALYSVAEYASHRIIESQTLVRVIETKLKNTNERN